MLRWLATLGIAALLALHFALPVLPVAAQGPEAKQRSDAPSAAADGVPFPDVGLEDLEGNPVALSSFRGKRVLLTFERSVDW